MSFTRYSFPFLQTGDWVEENTGSLSEIEFEEFEIAGESEDESLDTIRKNRTCMITSSFNENKTPPMWELWMQEIVLDDQKGMRKSQKKIRKKELRACDFCDFKVSSMIKHCDTIHRNEDGLLECPFCSKIFRTLQTCFFVKHLKNHEPSCDVCNGRFPKLLLAKHMETCGKSREKFSCRMCSFYSWREDLLKVHNINCRKRMKTPKPKKTEVKEIYLCDHCGTTVLGRSSFGTHVIQCLNEKKYKCETCGKRFNSKKACKRHQDRHLNNLVKTFVCEVCGKRFGDQKVLNQHKIVHTTELPYKCKDCGRGFNRQWNYAQHMRLHTGVKPYECPVCNEKFRHNVTMKQHKAKFHPETAEPAS